MEKKKRKLRSLFPHVSHVAMAGAAPLDAHLQSNAHPVRTLCKLRLSGECSLDGESIGC